jgi:hypothetical protein
LASKQRYLFASTSKQLSFEWLQLCRLSLATGTWRATGILAVTVLSATLHCRYLPALAVLLVNSALLPLLIESTVRYQRLKLKSSEAKTKLWLYSLNRIPL